MLEALVATALNISEPKERQAVTKASEAAFIQLGVTDALKKAKRDAESYAKWAAKTAGVAKPIAFSLFIAQTWRTKSATIPLSRRSTLTVGVTQTTFTLSF